MTSPNFCRRFMSMSPGRMFLQSPGPEPGMQYPYFANLMSPPTLAQSPGNMSSLIHFRSQFSIKVGGSLQHHKMDGPAPFMADDEAYYKHTDSSCGKVEQDSIKEEEQTIIANDVTRRQNEDMIKEMSTPNLVKRLVRKTKKEDEIETPKTKGASIRMFEQSVFRVSEVRPKTEEIGAPLCGCDFESDDQSNEASLVRRMTESMRRTPIKPKFTTQSPKPNNFATAVVKPTDMATISAWTDKVRNIKVESIKAANHKMKPVKLYYCKFCGAQFESGQAVGGHTSKAHLGRSVKYKRRQLLHQIRRQDRARQQYMMNQELSD